MRVIIKIRDFQKLYQKKLLDHCHKVLYLHNLDRKLFYKSARSLMIDRNNQSSVHSYMTISTCHLLPRYQVRKISCFFTVNYIGAIQIYIHSIVFIVKIQINSILILDTLKEA